MIIVTKVEREDTQGAVEYIVHYEHPEPWATAGHKHYIPEIAIHHRIAVYGCRDVAEAIDEIVHEALSVPYRNADRFPDKAERQASRQRFGAVAGLQAAMQKAGLTVPWPTEEFQRGAAADFIRRFGKTRLAAMRGVAVDQIPDQVTYMMGGRQVSMLAAPLPRVDPNLPPQANTPREP